MGFPVNRTNITRYKNNNRREADLGIGRLLTMFAFIIWSIGALIFILIGIGAWRSEQEVGFFTFRKAKKMKDVVRYNHAVGKLWFVFSAVLEILGIPFLFAEQNSPIFLVVILGVVLLVIATIIFYLRIENKYKIH